MNNIYVLVGRSESKNKDKRKRKIEQKWEAAVLHDKEYENKIFGGTKNLVMYTSGLSVPSTRKFD